jgi:hypothetical protein
MSITRRHFSCLAAGALFVPGAARAQSVTAAQGMSVVELFTSQGCSSCPPADALMVQLSKEPGIIPLTYPVQIWDYLGWRDTLAKPAFTRRQKAYAANVAGRRVYTPQAIVNGRAHCVGSDFSALVRLRQSAASASRSQVAVRRSSEGWTLAVSLAEVDGPAHVVLLPVMMREEVQIGRGENSGRSVTYANVVRDILDLGVIAPGKRNFSVRRTDLAEHGADGFAVLIQTGDIDSPGFVLAGALVGPNGVKA